MSFKRVERAGDLMRFGCSLKIQCAKCHAAQTLDGNEVYGIHGNRSLASLEKRLKCRRCKHKAATLTVLPPVKPGRSSSE